MKNIELGLGLLSIGRQWGVRNIAAPCEKDAMALLAFAYENGIRFFDTAPAYGSSEARLGRFLAGLSPVDDKLTIATKMGEQWDAETQTSAVSHSFDDLCKSLESSLTLLGKIDVLQLHKAGAKNVLSPDVLRAIDYAESLGVTQFGASISDMETARLVCDSGRYDYVQFPYNMVNTGFLKIFEIARKKGVRIMVNRPFAMGNLALSNEDANPFDFILAQDFDGVVLSGTSSSKHLQQNLMAFDRACFGDV